MSIVDGRWITGSSGLPYSLLRARENQVIARDSLSTPAMCANRDVTFYHFDSTRCWPRIVSAQPPISLAGLQAFADVFNPSHPCQRTLVLFPPTPVFLPKDALDEARARLGTYKHLSRPDLLVTDVVGAWVKYRGDCRDRVPSAGADTRSRIFVAHWDAIIGFWTQAF